MEAKKASLTVTADKVVMTYGDDEPVLTYKISGSLVAHCIENDTVLEELPLEVYKEYSPLFETDLYNEIDLMVCVEKRISEGGTSVDSVKAQINYVKEILKK